MAGPSRSYPGRTAFCPRRHRRILSPPYRPPEAGTHPPKNSMNVPLVDSRCKGFLAGSPGACLCSLRPASPDLCVGPTGRLTTATLLRTSFRSEERFSRRAALDPLPLPAALPIWPGALALVFVLSVPQAPTSASGLPAVLLQQLFYAPPSMRTRSDNFTRGVAKKKPGASEKVQVHHT